MVPTFIMIRFKVGSLHISASGNFNSVGGFRSNGVDILNIIYDLYLYQDC